MEPVLKAILGDGFAGRPGSFRFDPATGQRTPCAAQGAATTSTEPRITSDALALEPDPGQPSLPETGENAK
jgi:hypothetical protein